PGIDKQLGAAVDNALMAGEQFMAVHLEEASATGAAAARFYAGFGCPRHHLVAGELQPVHFMFNDPAGACVTCLGLGTYMKAHPALLVPDPRRSIVDGAFVPEAFRWNRDTWDGRMMYSLSRKYGFSLETPFRDLPPEIVDILFHGTKGERV